MKGSLIVLSAPSGTGKGTVVSELLSRRTDLDLSISWTTRAPRPGDEEGVTYFFKTEEQFDALVKGNGFLEYAGVYGRHYGTPAAFVDERLEAGRHVLLEIDTQGAQQVLKKRPDALSIFLLPPSMAELKRRLTGRGTESPEKVEQRFRFAYEELGQACHYRYCVVNDEVSRAVDAIETILQAQTYLASQSAGHIKCLQEENVL